MSSPVPGSRWANLAGSTGAAFLGIAETVGSMGVLAYLSYDVPLRTFCDMRLVDWSDL